MEEDFAGLGTGDDWSGNGYVDRFGEMLLTVSCHSFCASVAERAKANCIIGVEY